MNVFVQSKASKILQNALTVKYGTNSSYEHSGMQKKTTVPLSKIVKVRNTNVKGKSERQLKFYQLTLPEMGDLQSLWNDARMPCPQKVRCRPDILA